MYFWPACLGEFGPIARGVGLGLEAFGELLVLGDGDAFVLHHPLVAPEHAVEAPVDEHAEAGFVPPLHAGFAVGVAPPFLILHGDRDPLVPYNQSELLFDALKKAGVDVSFYKIVSAGHGGPQFQTPVTKAMVLAFLDQRLK
jgi:acetyl esterase/lipase